MIDLNSTSLLPDRINWFLDQAQASRTRERRTYLGASLIGGPCERQIQYQASGTDVDSGKGFPPRVLRCFDRGHWAESYLVPLMREAGFMLLSEEPGTDKQFGFSAFDGRFAGHCDGIIALWRGSDACPIPLPALWECKCLNAKSTAKAVKDKIRVSHPRYYNQVQLYMGEMGLSHCLFTVVSADSMELHHELIPYDAATHKAMMDRAWRILQALDSGTLVMRGLRDSACFECRYCDFATRCWSTP